MCGRADGDSEADFMEGRGGFIDFVGDLPEGEAGGEGETADSAAD